MKFEINKRKERFDNRGKERGFSLVELVIVMIIISILAMIALPQLTAWRRMSRASQMARTIFTEFRQARQQAMAQQQAISVVYNDAQKTLRVFGGSYGAQNSAGNKIVTLYGEGVSQTEIKYGIPSGITILPLPDGTSREVMPGSNELVITFRSDGTMRDNSNNLRNFALFIYNDRYPQETASAISVLGSSGRVKLWTYNSTTGTYVE